MISFCHKTVTIMNFKYLCQYLTASWFRSRGSSSIFIKKCGKNIILLAWVIFCLTCFFSVTTVTNYHNLIGNLLFINGLIAVTVLKKRSENPYSVTNCHSLSQTVTRFCYKLSQI